MNTNPIFLHRSQTCRYQVAEDVPCGVPFFGPPNQRYCAEHQAVKRKAMHKIQSVLHIKRGWKRRNVGSASRG